MDICQKYEIVLKLKQSMNILKYTVSLLTGGTDQISTFFFGREIK